MGQVKGLDCVQQGIIDPGDCLEDEDGSADVATMAGHSRVQALAARAAEYGRVAQVHA